MKAKIITLVSEAIKHDAYSKGECDFSVTEILKPPQQTALSMYNDPRDLGEYSSLASWVGTAIHEKLEEYGREFYPDAVHEERLFQSFDVGGKSVTLGGKPDTLHLEERVIQDYKCVKSAGLPKDDEPKYDHYWQAQFNAYLARKSGIPIDYFQIDYIGIDWRQKPFATMDTTPWKPVTGTILPDSEILPRLMDHLESHVKAKQGEARECTSEERWQRPDVYAVKKKGAKRSRKNCETEQEAKSHMKPGDEIELRRGECTRCERFCSYSHVCPQFKWSKAK
jgi:ferredoxin